MKTYAIIPAGGKGLRTGSEIPKQYIEIDGKEIIAYTIEAFHAMPEISEIIIAAAGEYFTLLDDIKNKYGFYKLTSVVQGGSERQDSVANALASIRCEDDDIVCIHDAARPLIDQNIIKNSITSASEFGASVVTIDARDTLLKGNEFVESYLERKGTYYVQTPQTFKAGIIRKAYKKAQEDNFYGTDESMLVSRLGQKIKIVPGSSLNFKITSTEDITMLKCLLSEK